MKGKQITKGQNPWILAGMAVGIVAILVGLVFLFGFKDKIFYGSASSSSGGTTRLGTAVFGADFYTDIYKSTTFAGNAVKGVYELLSTCFGMLFLLLGAADLCFFGSKLSLAGKAEEPIASAVGQPTEGRETMSAQEAEPQTEAPADGGAGSAE